MASPQLLSVVIPIFNEESNIEPLYAELSATLKHLTVFSDYEMIMVNDGSSDTSLKKLQTLAQQDPHVKIVSFVRNFGHEYATLAGLKYACGDACVLIDADLQDPPELILEFEREHENGYHIVFAQRKKRLKEPFLKKLTSKLFYPFFRYITSLDMPNNVGDYCMLSRRAVDVIRAMPERAVFIRGLIYWSGLSKKAIPFIRRKRNSGNSKYNYSKLTIFALENTISFSQRPIYYLIFISLGTIVFCFFGTIAALFMHFTGRVVMTGWTSLIICMLYLFAFTFFVLGILGLYIGKIFHEIKQRPPFLVDQVINIKKQKAAEVCVSTANKAVPAQKQRESSKQTQS